MDFVSQSCNIRILATFSFVSFVPVNYFGSGCKWASMDFIFDFSSEAPGVYYSIQLHLNTLS